MTKFTITISTEHGDEKISHSFDYPNVQCEGLQRMACRDVESILRKMSLRVNAQKMIEALEVC